jgi:CRP-like cAMP-binding protein
MATHAVDPWMDERPFSRRGWLSGAEPQLRARVLGAARQTLVGRGQRVWSAGDPPGGICGVVSGGIGAEGSTRFHLPRLGHVYRAGDWFGHGPVLAGGRRVMGFVALEQSLLLTVPLETLQAMMRDDPEMARLVGEMANRGTQLGNHVACDLLIPEAPRRIAAVLLRVTGALDGVEPDDPRGFLLTQAVLGEMANASRHHVNRVLGEFEREGWIAKSYNHIRVLDAGALADFAFSDD